MGLKVVNMEDIGRKEVKRIMWADLLYNISGKVSFKFLPAYRISHAVVEFHLEYLFHREREHYLKVMLVTKDLSSRSVKDIGYKTYKVEDFVQFLRENGETEMGDKLEKEMSKLFIPSY